MVPTPRYRKLIFCTHNIELLIHRVLRCLTVKEHRLWERVYIVYITLSFGYIGKYWYAVTLLYIIQCTVYTKYIVYCAVWWWKSIDRTSGLDGWHWPGHCDCKVYIKQPLLQKENQENNFQTILNIEVLRPHGGFWSLTLIKKNMFHDGTVSCKEYSFMNVPEATDNRGLKHVFVLVSIFDNKQSLACSLTRVA